MSRATTLTDHDYAI